MAPITFHTIAAVGFSTVISAVILWRLWIAISRGTVNFDLNFFFDTGFRDSKRGGAPEFYVDISRDSYPLLYWGLILLMSGVGVLLLIIAVVVLKVGIK
jgi:hypothetical protein